MKETLKDYCKKICDTELGCNEECKFWDYCDKTFSKWEHLTLKEAIAKKKQVDNILNDDDSYQARLDKVLSKFEKLVILNASFSYRNEKFYMQSSYLDQRRIEISLETVEHLIADLERGNE